MFNRFQNTSLTRTMAQMKRRYNTRSGGGSAASSTPYTPDGMSPVADAGSDQVVLLETIVDPTTETTTTRVTVNFDGSNSYDPDGGALTYAWSFGDGSTGSGETPSHIYTSEGSYTVELTVTDDENQTDSDTMTVTVQIPPPEANAGADQTVYVNTDVTFDGSASRAHAGRTITSYSWDFGSDATPATDTGVRPSCYYSAHGAKTVTLTVTDSGGDTDSDTMTVTVKAPPVADAGDDKEVYFNSNTNSVNVNFDGSNSYDPDGGALTYAWSFGDGSTGSGATPSHTYTSTGTYTVTLTVTDDEQVEASDSLIVTVQPDPGVLTSEPGPGQTVSVGSTVTFDGSGSYAPTGRTITSYSWDFGSDATPPTGTGVSPSCTYSAHGEKTVTLTVTDSGGDTDSGTMIVTVKAPPVADAGDDQTVELDSNTNSVSVSLDGSNSYDPDGGALTYAWNFGDGWIGSGAALSHTYTSAGTYTVTLTVTDDENITGSDTVTVTVQSLPPVADAGDDQMVELDSNTNSVNVSFDGSNSNDPDGGTLTYAWSFGDGSTGSGATPSHTYTSMGTYTVTLTVTDDENQTDSDTVTVTVQTPPPVPDAGNDQTVALDSNTNSVSVSFDGSASYDPDGGTLTYAWSFGDGSTGSGATPSHTYTSMGTYTVTLTVTDDEGARAIDTCIVTVLPFVLTADAGEDLTVSAGSTVTFDGSGSYAPAGRTITAYAWNFGDGSTGSGVQATHTYTAPGTYTVKLTVTDDQVAPDTATATDNLTLTVFRLDVDSDNTDNSLVFSDDSASGSNGGSGSDGASGASGASGGSGTRSESGTTTGSTTSTSSAQLTFILKPVNATITTNVHVDIYSSNTEATRVKRFDDVAGTGNTFAASWDGTDSEGYRVPDGNYQVRGTATYLASDGSSYSSVATHTVTVSGGSVSVKILNTDVRSNDAESANLYSDTIAYVDTVGHGTSGSRSNSATIRYEITGGRVEDVARRRVRLHIYKGDTKNKVKTINLGSTVGTGLKAYWGGTDDNNQFSYGEHFAIITLDLDFDSSPEPEAQEWKHSYRSNSHAITVYSIPVADAGGHQFFDLGQSNPKGAFPEVTFNASKSHDPDDGDSGKGISSYSWDFGDGSTGSGEIVTHTYDKLGTYTVELTVKDNDGLQPEHSRERTDEIKVTLCWLEDQQVIDGSQAVLSVGGDDDATEWRWSWRTFAPLGFGNSPDVPFSSTTDQQPLVSNARWFAHPDHPCLAKPTCTYDIYCNMTFPHGTFIVRSKLKVMIPNPMGSVRVVFHNKDTYNWRKNSTHSNRWEYAGIGGLSRGTTTLAESVHLPTTSQFYKATAKHEQKHIDQYMSPTGIARNSHSLADLETWLDNRRPSNPNATAPPSEHLFALTKFELDKKVSDAVEAFINDQYARNIQSGLRKRMEREAYEAEQNEPPPYFGLECFEAATR